jgi:DNA-binding CsgD family transcriptional regulator
MVAAGRWEGVPAILASDGLDRLPVDQLDVLSAAIAEAGRTSGRIFVWPADPRSSGDDRAMQALDDLACRHGIRSAVTVSGSAPGQGPCFWTMLASQRIALDRGELVLMQNVAPYVFETARIIAPRARIATLLTPRQLECLLWAARGKTDWEIGRILGIAQDTVEKQLARARERYGVDKTSTLIIRALFDGTLSFEDVLTLG